MRRSMKFLFGWILLLLLQPALFSAAALDGVSYTNLHRRGPLSIHVVRIARNDPGLEIRSVHSGRSPIGLSKLSEQLKLVGGGTPLAGINGDFYQRDGAFAGDPRGLQIVDGELISAPAGSASFWINAAGQPQMAVTESS